MEKNEIKNIGWTLGNDCPYRCPQCYSSIVRNSGRNLEVVDVDRIVSQIVKIGVKTVNLGGNEPIFTGGLDPRNTVLPYIIRSLHAVGIAVGLTTAGISLIYLERLSPDCIALLNDVDVSLDSPFAEEHNKNRNASLFNIALKSISICREYGIDRSIVMCGMNWNLTNRHIDALIDLARTQGALIRINFMKPTEPKHMDLVPDAGTFYRACGRLFAKCKVVELGEPLGSVMCGEGSNGCPCGTTSLRIHSITPAGTVPVSPCVYAHDFKVGDLLTTDLSDIIASPEFDMFRKRRVEPDSITRCRGCEYLDNCRGGCTARAHLWSKFTGENAPIEDVCDPYCLKYSKVGGLDPKPQTSRQNSVLVHRDYLCTVILDPS